MELLSAVKLQKTPNFGSFSYPKVQPHHLVTFCQPQGTSTFNFNLK